MTLAHTTAYARPAWKPTLDAALSFSTKALISAYRMARGGHPEFYVEIPLMPPSVNAIYRKWHSKKTNKTGHALEKSVIDFRAMADAACWGKAFRPRGTVGCVIVMESPAWLTLEYKVRNRDVDNPVKVVLDAMQRTLGMKDELVWEVHSAKIFSRREATHVWLFDLGEVVTAIGGPTTKGVV